MWKKEKMKQIRKELKMVVAIRVGQRNGKKI
jgi:hypothetical protein